MNQSQALERVARSPEIQRAYEEFRETWPNDLCVFCDKDVRHVESYTHFTVSNNEFPYNLYDGLVVTDHLLIIPKKHITTLSDMNAVESAELLEILKAYEEKSYNYYARSIQNTYRSVAHYHVHLIKLLCD